VPAPPTSPVFQVFYSFAKQFSAFVFKGLPDFHLVYHLPVVDQLTGVLIGDVVSQTSHQLKDGVVPGNFYQEKKIDLHRYSNFQGKT
jgi:hypothetical protein